MWVNIQQLLSGSFCSLWKCRHWIKNNKLLYFYPYKHEKLSASTSSNLRAGVFVNLYTVKLESMGEVKEVLAYFTLTICFGAFFFAFLQNLVCKYIFLYHKVSIVELTLVGREHVR